MKIEQLFSMRGKVAGSKANQAAFIQEKRMTLHFSFFQSVALAIALLVQASPARAEVITLVCQNESAMAGSFTLRVDYGRKIVDMLRSDGSAYYSAAATVTEGAVDWNAAVENTGGINFRGSLNRLTGQGVVMFPARSGSDGYRGASMYGPCRRATKIF